MLFLDSSLWGPAVCSGTGAALAPAPQADERLVAGGRDVRAGEGKWVYLYRAVDSSGATIDFLLSAKRDAATAQRFLTKALGGENHPEPRVINTDKQAAYPPAIVRCDELNFRSSTPIFGSTTKLQHIP